MTELADKISLHIIELLQLPLHAVDQEVRLILRHHIAESNVVQALAVPLDGPQVVSPLFLVVDELLGALLLPTAVVTNLEMRLFSCQNPSLSLSHSPAACRLA